MSSRVRAQREKQFLVGIYWMPFDVILFRGPL
jgi:hypothetical protein